MIRKRMKRRSAIARRHTGAAVVEFAVVAPLLVMLTFGMIEISRIVMVKQLLINASREGARLAVLPTATDQQVMAQIQNDLATGMINNGVIVLSLSRSAQHPRERPSQ